MNLSDLIDRQLIWKGEDLRSPVEPSFADLFPKGSVHQIFCDDLVQGRNLHAPTALPLVLAKEQTNPEEWDKKAFVFIGKECFPSIFFLRDCFSFKASQAKNFIYLNTPTDKAKSWALEAALSSTNVLCVMASLSTVPFIMSKRLSLLAEKNRALCFLFPTRDTSAEPSAAHAKWRFKTKVSDSLSTKWHVSLLHMKGSKTKSNSWSVRLNHEKEISIDLFSELVYRPIKNEATSRKCA